MTADPPAKPGAEGQTCARSQCLPPLPPGEGWGERGLSAVNVYRDAPARRSALILAFSQGKKGPDVALLTHVLSPCNHRNSASCVIPAVIPAQAEIHAVHFTQRWTPACAGVTGFGGYVIT